MKQTNTRTNNPCHDFFWKDKRSEKVGKFQFDISTYFGNILDKTGGTNADIKSRISKTCFKQRQ